MNRNRILQGLAIMLIALGAQPAVADHTGAEGTWFAAKQKLTIEVRYCGGENICGTLVGIKKPLDKNGNPKLDKENPDPNLRSRPVIGLEIMSNMKFSGGNEWTGKVYNADDGSTYRGEIKLQGDKFVVKGCWGPFCKKLNFRRLKSTASN